MFKNNKANNNQSSNNQTQPKATISIVAQLRAEREMTERRAYEARRERFMFSLKQSMLQDDYEYRNMLWDEED